MSYSSHTLADEVHKYCALTQLKLAKSLLDSTSELLNQLHSQEKTLPVMKNQVSCITLFFINNI